jgi:hypothetical protein
MQKIEDGFPVKELRVWDPIDKQSTQDALRWLQLSPRKDSLGWIQIGDNPPIQVTYKNRHTWEKILFYIKNTL